MNTLIFKVRKITLGRGSKENRYQILANKSYYQLRNLIGPFVDNYNEDHCTNYNYDGLVRHIVDKSNIRVSVSIYAKNRVVYEILAMKKEVA